MRQWQNHSSSSNSRTTATNRRIWCPEPRNPVFAWRNQAANFPAAHICGILPFSARGTTSITTINVYFVGDALFTMKRLKIPWLKLESMTLGNDVRHIKPFFGAVENNPWVDLSELYITPKGILVKILACRYIQVSIFSQVLHLSSIWFHNTTALLGNSYLGIHKREF